MEYQKISESVSEPFSENLKKLQELFPSVVKDGEVDFDALRAELGEFTEVEKEHYELNWAGKQDAQLLTGEPLVGKTLKYIAEESKNPETTENLYIEGDNLEALKLLMNSYRGKIKMIYIDPPYNTGKQNEFVYVDRFYLSKVESEIAEGVRDEEGGRLVLNPKTSARYHALWLSMIYPRLRLARDLLQDDGVIFISIDDEEDFNMRWICDEIFGSQNFMGPIIRKNNSMKNQSNYLGVSTDVVFVYAKNLFGLRESQPTWRCNKKGAADINATFKKLKKMGLPLDEIRSDIMEMYSRPKYAHLNRWNRVDEFGVFMDSDLSRSNGPKDYTIINPNTGKECLIPNRGWGKSKEELERLQRENLIWYGSDSTPPRMKSYITDDTESVFDNFIFVDTSIDKKSIDEMFGASVFEFPKPIEMLKQLISLCTNPRKNEMVLDFFSGSSSTAHAVMQLNAEDGGNRKFIMIQLPEVCAEKSEAYKAGYKTISDLGKERIRRAGEKIKAEHPEVDVGFKVFKVDDTNIRWLAAEAGKQGITLEDALTAGGKDLRDFMNGTNDLDVVYEILIRQYGIPLTAPIDLLSDIGERTYSIADTVVVCLEEEVTDSVIDKIANLEPIPQKIVFRDSAFGDDISLKENAMLRLDALMQKHAVGGRQPYSIEFL